MAAQGTLETDMEVNQQLKGYIGDEPPLREPQCHSPWSPETQQLEGEIGALRETDKQALRKLQEKLRFSNGINFASKQINLLALEYQERVISLNRGIEQKEREIQRLKALLAETDAKLLLAHRPVTVPCAQLASTWCELEAAKTTLAELQSTCEEKAAQKVRLRGQIQHLNHQLEEHGEQHSKDLHFMSERIVRSEVLIQQLGEHIRTGSDEAAMKNVLEGMRETAEFELRSFQESSSQAHDQNVATLNALKTTDQILLEYERSECRQLHQCIELLRKQVAALHSKGVWQQLNKRAVVQSAPLRLRGETELEMRQREGAESRLHKDPADWFRRSSGLDPSRAWGQTGPAASNPHRAGQEGNESSEQAAAQRTETGLVRLADSPSATVTAQSENLEDSQITQELSEEKTRVSSQHTVRESQTSPSATTCVKIQEVDSKGYFVQLFNTSHDKDVDLSGYILQQTIGTYPVSMYRFPPHTWLPTQQCLTVWASVADVSQKPPSDLVWKEQHKFRSGPECTTTLCKSNGQAIAWYLPAHRFSAAANSFDEKDDASEDWVPLPLNDQQISQEFSSQAQYMKQDGWAPSPEAMVTPETPSSSWTDFVPLQKRGRRISALFSSKGKRPQSDTSSLSERSSLWSRGVGETDISSYLQSSLISLPSDSLPGTVTPDSSSPQSTTQMSRRLSDAKGLTSSAFQPRLPTVRSLTGWVGQRSTRPKYGLRFMSYPLITADAINRTLGGRRPICSRKWEVSTLDGAGT